MKHLIKAATITAFALTGAAYAQSADVGPYIQGGYTYMDIEPEGVDDGVDTSAITARGGWRLTPHFGVEADISTGIDDGEFDYNVDEDDFEFDGNNDGDLNDVIAQSGDIGLNYLVGAYGTAQTPVTDRLSLHGRAGLAYIDLDATVSQLGGVATTNVEESASGPAVGGGLNFNITDHLELRGDYTYYSFEDTDSHAGSIVLGYQY